MIALALKFDVWWFVVERELGVSIGSFQLESHSAEDLQSFRLAVYSLLVTILVKCSSTLEHGHQQGDDQEQDHNGNQQQHQRFQ